MQSRRAPGTTGPLNSRLPGIARAWHRTLTVGPTWRAFLLVFTTALGVRLAYAVAYMVRVDLHSLPRFGAELGAVALNLYEGRGFVSPYGTGEPSAMFSPFVPALWAGLMHLVPGGPRGPIQEAIVLVQTLPSALTATVYWLVARRMAGKLPDVSTAFPSVVAAVFCFWPESILRVTQCWYYVWQVCGLALLVYTAMRWWDRPDLGRGLSMGAVAGWVGLVNPAPVPVFAIALAAPLLARRGPPAAVFRAAIGSGLLALAIVSPWIVRNALAFESFVPMRSNYGIELRQGNNPQGSIRQTVDSLNPTLRREELDRYLEMGEVEYAAWARGQAVAYMRENPGITMVRVLQRIYVSWCTDVFDFWAWRPETKWWRERKRILVVTATTKLSALVPLAIVLFGLASGRLRGLPYAFLFVSVFLFVPLPYYFTSANDYYTQALRPWLAMLALVVLLRKRTATR